MKITNTTKGTTLAGRAKLAVKTADRMKGLLGRDSLSDGEGLVIKPCSSIHTFGMRFPIDAVFFDRKLRVVKVYGSLKPMRVSGWHPSAAGVIEVAAGAAEGCAEAGDQLDFEGWQP